MIKTHLPHASLRSLLLLTVLFCLIRQAQAQPCSGLPTALVDSNTTATASTVYFTDATPLPASGYLWEVVQTGAGSGGTPVVSGTASTGVDSVPVTGLTASTTYDFYIQSDCGGASGLSTWVGPLTFTTPCILINSFPYSVTFNYPGLPTCWTATAAMAGAPLQWVDTTSDAAEGVSGPLSGTHFAYLSVYYGQTAFNTYNLTSPPITLPSAPQQLSYYYFLGNGGYLGTTGATGADPYPLAVQVSADGGLTWTDIYDHSTSNSVFAATNAVSNWQQNYINLSAYANQTIMVRFASNSNFGSGICDQGLDQLLISAVPACAGQPSLTAASAATTTTTTATVYWTDASPAPSAGYHWEVVARGAGSGATPVASGTSLAGDDSSLVTGLSASTVYDFYIQSDCGGVTGVGNWSGPLTITTACGIITSLPWLEGFEGLANNLGAGILPLCWSGSALSNWTTANGPIPFGGPTNIGPHTGNNYLYDFGGEIDTIFTPTFALTGGQAYYFSFYYETDGFTGWNSLQAMYGTPGSSPSALIGNVIYNPINTNYVQFIARFTPAVTGNYYLGVSQNSTFPFAEDIAFDDFELQVAPPCAGIPAISLVTHVTDTSAVAYWADATPAPSGGYLWIVVPSGAGTGATPVASGTNLVGDDSTLITGLSASTTYDYYIQADCGVTGHGIWAGPQTFATVCSSTTLPLTQGFNQATIPTCWTQQYVSGTENILYVPNSIQPTTVPQEGTDYVWWNAFSFAPGVETRLVSPPINSTGVPSIDVSFYWYNEHSQFYNQGVYLSEGVKVQYSTNGTTWTDVQFFPRLDLSLPIGTGEWEQKYLTLPLAAANQPLLYVGFSFVSEDGDNCSFDHLNITPSLPCPGEVSAIAARSLAPYSATVGWTGAPIPPAAGYGWRIVPTGDSVSGIAVDSGTTAAGVDSALVTGLAPNTTYDAYIRVNCGGVAGVGYWAGPVTFSTPCIAITSLPWTEGFEGLGANVGTDIFPTCWAGTPAGRWTTQNGPLGSPANIRAHTGTHYITDRSFADDTLFTPGFSLTAGTRYEFYYYYQTDGNAGWDTLLTMYGNEQQPSGMSNLVGNVILNPVDTDYYEFAAQFTPAASGLYYFGVHLQSTFNPYDIAFDDFGLKVAPPCAGLVSNVTVSHLIPTSALLSWTAATPAPAGGYIWELVATGDSVNGNVLFHGTTAAGVDSVAVSSISPETSYDLYVRTDCGGSSGTGDWIGPVTFTTPCAAITALPWHEGFEGLGTNVGFNLVPQCWLPTPSFFRWSTHDAPIAFANLNARTGSNYLTDGSGANDTVFTPSFTLIGGTQYQFYFYYQTDGQTGWDSIYAMYGDTNNQATMTARIGPVVLAPTNTSYRLYSAIFTPATSGTYYFGVKLSSGFTVDDIAFDDFGLQAVVACPNPPLAGTIGGPSSVCPGSTFNLTLTGYSPFTTIQWQTSSDSIHFSDLVGANQDVITTNVSSVSYFRAKVVCADTSYSAVFPVYINAPIYCYCNTSLGGYCGFLNIDTVAILNTNFDVANAPCVNDPQVGAYTQFPDTGSATTSLQRGGAYTLSIFLQHSAISSAWIDYNQDGSFDSSEWVQITTSGDTGSATLNIPVNAVPGRTGFRVRSNFIFSSNGPNDACTDFFDGETFDFYVTIVDTACSHTPGVAQSVTNVTPCYGDSNGAIALTITGSFGPYASLWSNGDTTATLTDLRGGIYTDTISYDYGCRYIWHDTVAQPADIGYTDSIRSIRCYGGTNGAIFVSVLSGVHYHWSSGDTSLSLTGKPAGVYVDTIRGGSSCVVLLHDTIRGALSALAVLVDSTHAVKCNGQATGAVYISVSGGLTPYQYIWSNTSTAPELLNVPAHEYTVTVSDINGCTATASDSVSQPPPIHITTDSVLSTTCAGSSDGSIYVHVTGGKTPYTYLWTGGSASFNLYLQPAGVYTLTITDAYHCVQTASDTISSPHALSVSSQITNQIGGGALGSIIATPAGGTAPYTYKWSNGDTTAGISGLTAKPYTVTVTDHHGCTASQTDSVDLINSIIAINGDVTDFNIYPNPSSGVFNIQVYLTRTVPVLLEIYTITGELLPLPIRQGQAIGIYQLDLSDRPSGVYLVKVTAGDYSSYRKVTLLK